MLVPTNESKEKNKKYEDLWSRIRDRIRWITKTSDDYDEKYINIKFSAVDELSLNKTIKSSTIKIVLRAIFLKNNKYYPQVFFDECLYKKQSIKMEIKDGLKEIIIINHTCYYFVDIIKYKDIYFVHIWLDNKSYKTYKTINS